MGDIVYMDAELTTSGCLWELKEQWVCGEALEVMTPENPWAVDIFPTIRGRVVDIHPTVDDIFPVHPPQLTEQGHVICAPNSQHDGRLEMIGAMSILTIALLLGIIIGIARRRCT